MKRWIAAALTVLCLLTLAACGSAAAPGEEAVAPGAEEPALADGVYTATFTTDSTMFHANETKDGKGVLTVENGEMTIHVVLASTSIVNLYPGTAEEAQAEGAVLLEPTLEEVKYSDGTTDEANAFDIPVPYLDEDFPCALIGKKGVWYDHSVSVSDPEPMEVPAA
ncbi:MAG: hypothetical protein IJQ17_02930 [Oscillospiraceae bacterium]|nr:hypothetical protein [Oscillospiraceae bacterium]MBQ6973755.1 hypothetical protein [Oscillospiraceae bacterium]